MTKMRGVRMSYYGYVQSVSGAYIMVRPENWPRGTRIEFLEPELTWVKPKRRR